MLEDWIRPFEGSTPYTNFKAHLLFSKPELTPVYFNTDGCFPPTSWSLWMSCWQAFLTTAAKALISLCMEIQKLPSMTPYSFLLQCQKLGSSQEWSKVQKASSLNWCYSWLCWDPWGINTCSVLSRNVWAATGGLVTQLAPVNVWEWWYYYLG